MPFTDKDVYVRAFIPMSHLIETSNMTTRANRQSPAAGLTPAGSAALQAAPHSGLMFHPLPGTDVACSNKHVSWSLQHPHFQPKNKPSCDLRDLRLTNVSRIFCKRLHHLRHNLLMKILLHILQILNICVRPFATSRAPVSRALHPRTYLGNRNRFPSVC